MNKSFLTHGWPDAALVSNFAQALEGRGIPVYLDKWDLSKGAMTWATLDQAIDEAEKLVVFVSRDALKGNGVKEELDRGLQKAYEKHGEIFIIPVALDPHEDVAPLLPIRIRGANMIRAYDQDFETSIAEIEAAVLGKPAPRSAAATPTDFFYRLHPYANGMVIELGTGLPVQDGFGFETVWPEEVKHINGGMGPAGHPERVAMGAGMWTTANGFYIPPGLTTRLCPAYSNRSIRRNESFFMQVANAAGGFPQPPSVARLYDQFHQLIRDPLKKYP